MKHAHLALTFAVLCLPLAARSDAGQRRDDRPNIHHSSLSRGDIWLRGAPIRGASGLAFDSDDVLHLACAIGREILAISPEDGQILERYGVTQGVEMPEDLTFGPAGSAYENDLFWTSIMTGQVGRLTAEGESSTVGHVQIGVNPIAFSDDVRLYVAHSLSLGTGGGLYEIDPAGIEAPIPIAENLHKLNGFTFGPDGWLYSAVQREKVVRIDVAAEPTVTVQDVSSIPATAVKFGPYGQLHAVLDDEVVRIDPESGAVTTVAKIEPGLNNLAFDSQGRLYVSNHRNGAVYRVHPDGRVETISRGGFIAAGGIAVVPNPTEDDGFSVVLADMISLREFDGMRRRPTKDREVLDVVTVAPFGENLVTTGWGASTVQIVDRETFETIESLPGFEFPTNAIEFDGELIVAELGFGAPGTARVVRGDGVVLADNLDVPGGLAATDSDVWVADWATGEVLQVVMDAEVISPIVVAAGLSHPEGLAVNHDGSLLVVETGRGQLSRIDVATGTVRAMATGLALGATGFPGASPMWLFTAVAVAPNGDIFVAGDADNVVYRFEQRRRRPRRPKVRLR